MESKSPCLEPVVKLVQILSAGIICNTGEFICRVRRWGPLLDVLVTSVQGGRILVIVEKEGLKELLLSALMQLGRGEVFLLINSIFSLILLIV